MEGMLRIGVFYDGNHFNYAQNYFWGQKQGWLSFPPFHKLLEDYVEKQYQGFADYKVVYSVWYQGLFTSAKSDEKKLKLDRRRHHDMMHAGIESKFYPMSQSGQHEKAVDVAMAIDILQVGFEGVMDVAILVTGDGDFVPLVRALMKRGVNVIDVYFEYEDGDRKSFSNERLKDVCNYALNINGLQNDKEFKSSFKTLFKQLENKTHNGIEP